MSKITYDYMEDYIRGLIPNREGRLKEIEDLARENGVPIVQKETGVFLEFMTSMKKPKRILELGTAVGFSSILMYEAAGTEPEIITIERDEKMIELATSNLEKFNLGHKIKIEKGDCLEILEKLNEPFDFIFMDAGKGHYNHFLPHCLRLLSQEGIIVADNVLFRGMVASQELVKRRKITIVKRMRTYLDMVTQDEKLITSVIPMGDGIAVTKRR
ncbi:O-methyltransferase [Clostridium saccharobutylicum]|uniref:tRNA 5-hydroxyuridine methyltransferase n=1 Tax=Clostridium saccharobutylicum DSM 13864 TaxID=1345695 RepID=U5MP83_CLOSA|nr:O-methyltransferase [Clostridium saccharobutylicum]AGX42338.1 putative O-methyltransferase YrrM [Clostridium saccharobutylicum DSM 13864]AQR89619.1 putative O-methyltransferase [Clostridium saccharobutylicum]AQR99521.1 putative O-methyltransferase [Clostridium saccharobutylicum]AQS13507.1 putative O-methyltransferase [Clostridium saccharobutylicum]MBA2904303.1 putative O-methyltransferase YrrM [Clostridium saccharobutylicum]